jgi:3-dehydroquinate synthase II/3-amino-4-hydroxybenzoic acid synthase
MQIVLKLKNEDDTKSVYRNDILSEIINNRKNQVIISSASVIDLKKFQGDGYITCFECYVDNNKKLLSTIKDGLKFDYVWILFRDPTNIPLELVIASLQSTNTILMKEINNPENVDDAIVSYGVMEYGAEGVIFSPIHHDILTNFIDRLSAKTNLPIKLQVGTVVSAKPVGMGYRACIDTATIFDEDEGMLVGSTSQGGILCCPEVFFLPYMELRPFRINAGAVHSYVFNINNRTDYMTELKAGSSIMIVNSKGQVRSSPVGRMKIEKRPLRLIEVEFEGGKNINILMQDDWHVRIFSNEAKPLNISELKKGDKVLGYVTETGRHVGIKIDENIIEK